MFKTSVANQSEVKRLHDSIKNIYFLTIFFCYTLSNNPRNKDRFYSYEIERIDSERWRYTFKYLVFEIKGSTEFKNSSCVLHPPVGRGGCPSKKFGWIHLGLNGPSSTRKKLRKSFGELNLSSSFPSTILSSKDGSQFPFYIIFLIACTMAMAMKQSFSILKEEKKNSTLRNNNKEITICSLRKPKIIFSMKKKTIRDYFTMQIICCFLLHDT